MHRESRVPAFSEIVRYFDKTAYLAEAHIYATVRKTGKTALKTGMNQIIYRSGNKAKIIFDSFGGHTP